MNLQRLNIPSSASTLQQWQQKTAFLKAQTSEQAQI